MSEITSINICAAGPTACHSCFASLSISGVASADRLCACSMIGCALIEKIDQRLGPGRILNLLSWCVATRPETWPTSSRSQCSNIV